jgi:hypothetical protein
LKKEGKLDARAGRWSRTLGSVAANVKPQTDSNGKLAGKKKIAVVAVIASPDFPFDATIKATEPT